MVISSMFCVTKLHITNYSYMDKVQIIVSIMWHSANELTQIMRLNH